MRQDSRLSVALHVLLHMVEMNRVATSEELATALNMNAVVLRRMLSALRDAGIVRGAKGHGGGWELARSLEDVAIGEIFVALGEPPLFRIGPRDPASRCPIERSVDQVIGGVLGEASALVERRLGSITVASLLVGARTKKPTHRSAHA